MVKLVNLIIMKLKIIAILAPLLMGGLTGYGEPPKPLTVAVFEFSSNSGSIVHRDFTALFTADLSTNSNLVLVERGTQLRSVLGEEALGLSGNISPESAASIGVLTGAKVLVTGRVLTTKNDPKVTVVASIVGTETGRMFAQTAQGPRNNLASVAADLSQKIAQTIAGQSTNFTVDAATLHANRLREIIASIKGRARPAVSVRIDEQIQGNTGTFRTAETELELLLQKAGFAIVDEKSDRKPDVIINGDAVATSSKKTGNLCSGQASLEIKAQERTTGKILTVDSQEKIAVDIGEPMAARKALQNATDELAERLLPVLAQ
jgi:hypothetical protein